MAEIVNLRRIRKARARAEAAATAAANRAAFGRTKAERMVAETDAARLRRDLDGSKCERDG